VIPVFFPLSSFEIGKKDGTLIIIGPDLGYSKDEIEEIGEFLERGGTLILMDDFGTGNEILRGLNLSVRFSERQFMDVFYQKNENFPQVVRILDPELGEGVDGLVLNIPSVILNAKGEVYSSKISLLVKRIGEYPIMTTISYGNGKIVLFSDPSVFINDMFQFNEEFVRNFIDQNVRGRVYVDEAHHSNFNIYQSGTVTLKRSVDETLLFQVIFLVALTFIVFESGLFHRLFEILTKILQNLSRVEKENDLKSIIKTLEKEGCNTEILLKMIEEIEKGKKLGGRDEWKRTDGED
jgi:hypothetical protein